MKEMTNLTKSVNLAAVVVMKKMTNPIKSVNLVKATVKSLAIKSLSVIKSLLTRENVTIVHRKVMSVMMNVLPEKSSVKTVLQQMPRRGGS